MRTLTSIIAISIGAGIWAFPSGGFAKTINGTSKNDKLKGTPKADVFYGQAGNDRMIGGENILGIGGKDKAYGGKGNDIYEIFGEPGEFFIIERKASGNDTWIPSGFVGARTVTENISKASPWVKTTKSGDKRVLMRLPDHVENLNCMVWNGAISENAPTANYLFTELHGNDLNNVMTSDDRGNAPDEWIKGAFSHDRIYGYGGDDTFRYGRGNDAYYGGDGWDTLDLRLAKVSVLINAEAEIYVDLPAKLMVYGAIRNNQWVGDQTTLDGIESVILSRGVDHVKGSANGDYFIIDQGDRAGGDRIWAGAGNDTLVIKRGFSGYQHVFYYGETGFDTLDLSDFQVPVTIDLGSSDDQPVPNGEGGFWQGIQLLAVEAVYSGNKSDTLSGNSAITEIFRPGRGNDSIKGDNTPHAPYANVDYIYFDTPLDAVNNVDTILDVKTETDNSKRLEDILYLDHRIFKNIITSAPGGAAYLAASRFKRIGTGGSAVDADDRILVDQELGEIYYDADGSGSSSPVLFAKFTPGISVGAANFATY
jgi:Ca2+-binding RTX toxin-like protein